MPIIGLSEQRRFPRSGKIHLGRMVANKSGNGEHPEATEFFMLPEELSKIYGEQCTELPIMIPTEDDEYWCGQYYKRYSMTRGLICKGDGATCRRMVEVDVVTEKVADRNTKEVVWKEGLPCTGMDCPDYKSKACKEVMNLQFIIPDAPGIGIWQVDTSSINPIRNINSVAALVRKVYNHVAFIPMLLTLEPIEVINPDDGKKKTVRVLNLRIRGTMRELMAQATKPYTELLLPTPEESEPALDEPSVAIEATATVKESSKKIESKPTPKPPDASQDKQGTEETPPPDKKSNIDIQWLDETLKIIKWKETTALSWIKVNLKITFIGTLVETCNSMKAEQLHQFVKKLQDMREAAGQ